jgi:hypothetical protein
VRAAKTLRDPTAKELKQDVVREQILAFLTAVKCLPKMIRSRVGQVGFRWFKLGELLYDMVTVGFLQEKETGADPKTGAESRQLVIAVRVAAIRCKSPRMPGGLRK